MNNDVKKLLSDFAKGLIPLVASLLGGLISIYLGSTDGTSIAIGSVLGGLIYSAC